MPERVYSSSRHGFDRTEPVVITLQSSAMMIDPAGTRAAKGQGRDVIEDDPAERNEDELTESEELYAAYWAEVSKGSLTLKRCFASHRLIGGYQSHVFRRFVTEPDGERTARSKRSSPTTPPC